MINIRHMTSDDRKAWDVYVDAHPNGSFCHLSGWSQVIEEGGGHQAHFLLAEDENNHIVGILPLSFQNSLVFGKALNSTSFAVYGGPLVSNEQALEQLDKTAWNLAQELGVNALEYRSLEQQHSDWALKDDVYVTFKKELFTAPEANLTAIPRKQRAMVRKGIKFGLTANIEDDLNLFYGLYAASVRNLGTPVFPKKLFETFLDVFRGQSDILIVRDDQGQAISGVLSFYYKGEVLPYYGGGVAEARKLAANDFMYYALMEHAVTRGMSSFDFGRSKIGTGAYNFKKHWGFEAIPLAYEYKLADGYEMPNLNPLNPKYQLMIKVWRHLPLWLTTIIGPPLARHLG